jgi:hypothetical protein
MANGKGIIERVQNLLGEKETIPVKTALRLTLELMLEMHKAIEDQAGQIADNIKLIELNRLRVDAIERKSIVCWAERHPKLAVFVVTVVLVLGTIVDIRVVIAKALGIDL